MKHLKLVFFLCFLTFTVSCGQQKRYIQYKVKKGETMSKIAQKLDMRTNDLIRLNPDVVSEPSANSFIVVPEKKLENFKNKLKQNKEVETDSIVDNPIDEKEKLLAELKEKYLVYEVKKGDTFYNLGKVFDVTRGELLLLNPELKEGLKEGMLLKIKENPLAIVSDEIFYDDYIDYTKSIHVALLLPFRASRKALDTLSPKEIYANKGDLMNIVTDFYLGAELAVDSLSKRGVDITLNVYDTGDRRSSQISDIISTKNLGANDVLIGPLYSDQLEIVAANVNVPIVFPVYSNNQSDFSSSNIIKTSPDKKIFRTALENYVKENFEEGNIIIVTDSIYPSVQQSEFLRSSLALGTNAKTVAVLTAKKGLIEKDRFLQILKPNTNNWVIIDTADNIIVPDAINSLISLPEETTVKVFTPNKENAIYDRIDNRKLAKIGFTFVSDEYVDETSLGARVFTKQYLATNNALPSYYATKGFDITFDILMRLASGRDLKSTFMQGFSSRVETKFDYRNSSFIPENQGLFILQYNKDLTLTRLK